MGGQGCGRPGARLCLASRPSPLGAPPLTSLRLTSTARPPCVAALSAAHFTYFWLHTWDFEVSIPSTPQGICAGLRLWASTPPAQPSSTSTSCT